MEIHMDGSGRTQENGGGSKSSAREGQTTVPRSDCGRTGGGSEAEQDKKEPRMKEDPAKEAAETRKETAEITFRIASADEWEQKPGTRARTKERKGGRKNQPEAKAEEKQ